MGLKKKIVGFVEVVVLVGVLAFGGLGIGDGSDSVSTAKEKTGETAFSHAWPKKYW